MTCLQLANQIGLFFSSTTVPMPQSGCFIIQLPRRVLRVYWLGYLPGSVCRERVSGASSLVCAGLKKNENRQNYSFSSTRNSVSKLCRADLQSLGLKTPLKTVSFQLFCWVLLFQYSKKFDFPEGCLVSLWISETER